VRKEREWTRGPQRRRAARGALPSGHRRPRPLWNFPTHTARPSRLALAPREGSTRPSQPERGRFGGSESSRRRMRLAKIRGEVGRLAEASAEAGGSCPAELVESPATRANMAALTIKGSPLPTPPPLAVRGQRAVLRATRVLHVAPTNDWMGRWGAEDLRRSDCLHSTLYLVEDARALSAALGRCEPRTDARIVPLHNVDLPRAPRDTRDPALHRATLSTMDTKPARHCATLRYPALYCATLCDTVRHCATLCDTDYDGHQTRATLRYPALYCATLCDTVRHCATLRDTALHRATLSTPDTRPARPCATLRDPALHCAILTVPDTRNYDGRDPATLKPQKYGVACPPTRQNTREMAPRP
jgi:hypothetical protein